MKLRHALCLTPLLFPPALPLAHAVNNRGAAAAPGRPAPGAAPSTPDRLRPLTGAVHVIARDEQPLPAYLDRLEAMLLLEQAHGNVGPYTVSATNSLEALTPEERKELGRRGERLLLRAYVALASFTGPQAGRLGGLYAMGLSQVLGVKADEVVLTEELATSLQRIGAYAVAAAERLRAGLGGGDPAQRREQAELQIQLDLARGRYPEAYKAAQALQALDDAQAPAPLTTAYRLGAQRLQEVKAPPAKASSAEEGLLQLERSGGGPGALALMLQRRAAREALLAQLQIGLRAPTVPEAVRARLPASAAGPGKKARPATGPAALLAERALTGACEGLLADERGHELPVAQECALLQQEGLRSDWASRPFSVTPGDTRATLLNLTRSLGALLGLPGRPPARDAAERGAALAEVTRLLPGAGLSPEEAAALTLLAQVASTRGAGQAVAPQLHPAIDKFLATYPCSRLSLPLLHGRHAGDPPRRLQALRATLSRCSETAAATGQAEADEALRQLALALLGMDARDEGALKLLRGLAQRHGGAGEGRYALALADGEALHALEGQALTTAALRALQQRYEDARAQLSPWDGAEVLGRTEAQLATLLLWRHRLPGGAAPPLAVNGAAAPAPPAAAPPAPAPAAATAAAPAPSLGAVGASARPDGELLSQAETHLRFARILSGAEDAPRVQALEVAVQRERARQTGAKVVASQARADDLARLPQGPLRRALACELEQTALLAKDSEAAAGFHKLAVGDPLPAVITLGQPRLSASLGSDGRLRVMARSTGQVLLLPRCTPAAAAK